MKELSVNFRHLNQDLFVGTLAKKAGRVYFEYDDQFLSSGIEISPYSIPLQKELLEFKNFSFSDIFGGFSDALPDGWGLLLMDRFLKQLGSNHRGLSSFERLAYMGDRSMGALSFSPVDYSFNEKNEIIDLYDIATQSVSIYEGSSDEVIEQLARVGGSPGGARPKIVVTQSLDGSFRSDSNIYNEGDEHWLIKFDISREFKNFSKVEYLYSLIAKKAGIEMPETKLFKDLKGNNYFGIKRFDRLGNKRIHTHTFGSLIESNFRIPDQDYSALMAVTFDLTKNIEDVYRAYRLMVFNYYTTNQDDHVKNFSFVLDSNNCWKFAPAYDLTPSFGQNGWHSMTINNKGKDVEEKDFLSVAAAAGLNRKRCLSVIEEVKDAVISYKDLTKDCGIDLIDIKRLKESYILL